MGPREEDKGAQEHQFALKQVISEIKVHFPRPFIQLARLSADKGIIMARAVSGGRAANCSLQTMLIK